VFVVPPGNVRVPVSVLDAAGLVLAGVDDIEQVELVCGFDG
jgi:hypothetical protein